jgi:hypothetical protein
MPKILEGGLSYKQTPINYQSPWPRDEGALLDQLIREEELRQKASGKDPYRGDMGDAERAVRKDIPAWLTPPDKQGDVFRPAPPPIRAGQPERDLEEYVNGLPEPVVEDSQAPSPTASGIAALDPSLLNPELMAPPNIMGMPQPATPAAESPETNLERAIKLYNQLAPTPPSGMTEADRRMQEYAEKEMQRTKLMARLALAGGLTAAGGGSWTALGQGFMNAAQAYDSGHQRYLNALQSGAQMHRRQQQSDYENQLNRTNSVIDLYTSFESADAKAAKAEADKRRQSRKDRLDEFQWMTDVGDNVIDPAERAKEIKRRGVALETGEYVDEIYDDY